MDLLYRFWPNEASVLIATAGIAYCVVATILLPGKWALGVPLDAQGTRIPYKINGSSVQITAAFFFWILSDYGLFSLYRLTIVIDNYLPLLGTLLCFSILFSTFLYLRAWLWIDKVSTLDGMR